MKRFVMRLQDLLKTLVNCVSFKNYNKLTEAVLEKLYTYIPENILMHHHARHMYKIILIPPPHTCHSL